MQTIMFRVTVTHRYEGVVHFNLFAFNLPEQNAMLIDRCGNGAMTEEQFKALLKAIDARDVSTNIEMYDRSVEVNE